ncbi:hypothetical protein [Halalkalibacter lacteus]|uniref:hypothetical protein n=1 Tax=Halalkalibacter lacteus TaxID=3090663 RepID=UPI002FCC86A6
MMKKMMMSVVLGTVLIASTVHAEDPDNNQIESVEEEVVFTGEIIGSQEEEETSVDLELINFVGLFQEVAVELTADEKDKLRLLVEFVSQSNEKIEVLLQKDRFEEAAHMLEKYNLDIEEVQVLLSGDEVVSEEKAVREVDHEIEELEGEFTEKTSMRGVNLQLLLEREDLPDSAKAGIEKALANQAKALEKSQAAKETKEERKALKAETKASKDERDDEEGIEVDIEEKVSKRIEGKPVQKKNVQAQKAQHKAEQGQKRAAEAKENAKKSGKGNSNNGKGNGNKPANSSALKK